MKRNIFIVLVSILILTCLFVSTVGAYPVPGIDIPLGASTTTDLELIKPEWTDEKDILDDLNANSDILEAFANDVLEHDLSPVLRAALDIATFDIEGVDATEFSYLNGISSFGGTLIDDANAAAGRVTLELAIGVNIQAYDAGLLSIAGLTTAANKSIYTTALDTYAVYDLTAFGRSILDDADGDAVRTTIGAAVLGANTDITSLTGLTTPLGPAYGGTGVANNAASTLTISGNFATTLTVTEATGVTLPASGTLYGTLADSITSANLLSSVSDETGSGKLVFGTSPSFTTSILPASDSAVNLGSSAPLYFANAYIDKLYFNSTAAISGSTAGKLTITGDLRFSDDTSTLVTMYIGANSAILLDPASNNYGLGQDPLAGLTAGGINNTAMGSYTLYSCTIGDFNVGVGQGALQNMTTSIGNVGIGQCSLNTAGLGDTNVGIGQKAGEHCTGANNTFIGGYSGNTAVGVSGNVFIGYKSGYYETASNKLFIDNAPRTNEADGRVKALVYGKFAAAVADQELTVNAKFQATRQIETVVTMDDGDATPDISAGNVFVSQANTGATEITDLDNPTVGQIVTIICGDAGNAPTITDGGNFALSAAWNSTLDDVLVLFVQADNDYIEISRSVN